VVLLNVIVKTRQLGNPGPLGAVALLWAGGGVINITEFLYINLINLINFLPSGQAKPPSTMIPGL
jgi:hypothetical protein